MNWKDTPVDGSCKKYHDHLIPGHIMLDGLVVREHLNRKPMGNHGFYMFYAPKM